MEEQKRQQLLTEVEATIKEIAAQRLRCPGKIAALFWKIFGKEVSSLKVCVEAWNLPGFC